MKNIVIYCKSYSKDLYRVSRLVKSVAQFNTDNIPFYISVPRNDLTLFQKHLDSYSVILIADEEILDTSFRKLGRNSGDIVSKVPVHLMQQIIKAEFWRWGRCKNYLVIDSDSYFIRPFSISDFFYDENTPYTVMHECKELLQFAVRHRMNKVKKDYIELREKFQKIFDRRGRYFDFGPTPVIWSSMVWERLSKDYAEPGKTNIFEMICKHPCELLWYGEYLLHATSFPIVPVEPLFKVYHYKEQFQEGQQFGENEKVISENFLGIVVQSNWDRSLDVKPNKPSFINRIFQNRSKINH